jgi:predicted XRE-type DNA-binding protein
MNQDIKNYAKSKGVRLWQIAEALHINDGNFSRKLRKELSEAQKEEIIRIIDRIAEKRDMD